jgi:hypothetical protein
MDRPGFASVTSAAYGSAAEYDIEVDAGAMAPPGQAEQVQKVRSLAMDLGGNPALAGMTNWQAVGEMLVEAAGYDPQRVLMAPMQPGLVDPGSVPPRPGSTPFQVRPLSCFRVPSRAVCRSRWRDGRPDWGGGWWRR